MIDVATYFKKIRVKKGLTMEQVADAVGCSYQSYQGYEAGKTSLINPNFYKICDVLGISPIDVFKKKYVSNTSDLVSLVNEPENDYNNKVDELQNKILDLIGENAILAYKLQEALKDNRFK